jgi:hypothetical protein
MPVALPLAIAGAAVVGAVATSSAASKAANAQTASANQANQTQRDFYNQTRADLQPYNEGGQKAYSTLNDLLGVGGGDSATMQKTLEGLPGYQFTRDQGLKATQSGYAARGLADSGGALKGAANYTTGLANSQYGTYVNQLQNSANLGESAAAKTGQFATDTGSGIAANTIGAGNAQAAAYNTTGKAIAGAANNSLGGYLYSLNNGLINGQQGGSNSNASPTSSWYNVG